MAIRRKTRQHLFAKTLRAVIVAFLVVMLSGNIYALAGSSATGVYKNIYATGIYDNWDGVTNVAQFAGPDGNLYFAVDSDTSVVVYKTSNGTLVSGKVTLEKQHSIFGTVVCDAAGYYYLVTGDENYTDDNTAHTVFVSKYDSKGKHIKTVGLSGDAKHPFYGGNCDAAIYDGIITVFFGKLMYSGHQSSSSYSFYTSDLSFANIGFFYESHSFAQRVIPTKEGFAYMSEGDCFDRAFRVRTCKVSNGSTTYAIERNIFDFWVREGAYDDYDMWAINDNFAHMGGLAMLSDGKIAFAAQSVQSLNANAASESEEVFIQIFDPYSSLNDPASYVTTGERSGVAGNNGRTPVTNYGVKWLTSYGNDYTVSNVQIAATSKKEIVVLYELYDNRKEYSDRYQGVYYMLLNEAGYVTLPATRFDAKAKLNPCETPISKDGKVYWVGNRNGDDSDQIYIYTLDPSLVKKPLTIHLQPKSMGVAVGSTVSLSVIATGEGTLKYQWQCKAPGSSTWTNSGQTGSTTSKLTFTTTTAHNGYQYRCVITDGNGNKKSSGTATITVKPKITTQPTSKTVAVGETAVFSVAATGKATLKYQWQAKAPGSSSWSNSTQSGATTVKLSVATNVNHNGYQYRCAVTDGNGITAYSSVVTLTIVPKITSQPANITVLVGNTATFSVAVTGKATLKYQWQAKAPGSSSWSNSTQSGATTAKLSVATNVNHNGYQYRCVVTDGNGKKSYSSAATLTIKPKITVQPKNTKVQAGTVAAFSVTALGKETVKYQWQCKEPGATSWRNSALSTAKNATISIKTDMGYEGYQYRCVVTDGNGNQTISGMAMLTLISPGIPTQPQSLSVQVGSTATFSVTAKGTSPLKYQWQAQGPKSSTWSDSTQSGATTSRLSVATTVNHNGYKYRCVVTDGKGNKTISEVATLTVAPKITKQPIGKNVAVGSNVTFSVSATGKESLRYQWQYLALNSSTWANSTQSGATTATMTITTNVNHQAYRYRCVVTDGNGVQTISDEVVLTLYNIPITEQYFTDSVFRKFVGDNLDSDGNGKLSSAEIDAVNLIDLNNQDIGSLKGVEYFRKLETLYCDSNRLKTLNLKGCVLIKGVSCSSNQLKSLDLYGCSNLEYLYCGHNNLTSLDITHCGKLGSLICEYNQLTSLDLSQCTELDYISCLENQLTSLDFSNCPGMKNISCDYNQLTIMNVSGCTALKNVYCANNQIKALNFSNCPELSFLKCESNQLTSLNVSGCNMLVTLYCTDNQLSTLDVSTCTELRILSCESNQLKSLDVSKNVFLTALYCCGNNLTKIDVSHCTILQYCSIDAEMTLTGAGSGVTVMKW